MTTAEQLWSTDADLWSLDSESDEEARTMRDLNGNCHITGEFFFPKLHPSQRQLITAPRHVIARCGRRWGKTEGAVNKILRAMRDKTGLYLWYGQSWDNDGMLRAERLFLSRMRYIWRAYEGVWDIPEKMYYSRKRREMKHPEGSILRFKTAQNPEGGRGDGLQGVVLDECAHYDEEIFTQIVRPAVMRSRGWICMLSTPRGMNWFFAHWQRVENNPEWLRIHAKSEDNPYIPKEEIEAARLETPEEKFRQEYLAEFVDAGWGVFSGLDKVIDDSIEIPGHPREGGQYVFGVDFAKVHDYTVIAVWDLDRKALVHFDRFNRIAYDKQEERIEKLYRRWQPERIICDNSGVGIGVIDGLKRRDLPVQRFNFTQQSKEKMIEEMAYDIGNGLIWLPNHPLVLDEFRGYTKEKNPSGTLKYGAPQGAHDDIVHAVGLGHTMVTRYDSGLVL